MASKVTSALQSVVATTFHIFYSEKEKETILKVVETLLEHKNALQNLKRNQREIVRLCLYLTLGCNGWQFRNAQKTSMAELLRIIEMIDCACAYKNALNGLDEPKETDFVDYEDDYEEEVDKMTDANYDNAQFSTIVKNLYPSMKYLSQELTEGKLGENIRDTDWYWDYSSMRDHSAAASDLVMGKNLITPSISEPYRWIGAIAGTDMFDKDRTKIAEFVDGSPDSQQLWKKHLFLHTCFNDKLMKIDAHTWQMVEFVTGTRIYVAIRALPKVQYRLTLISLEKRRIYAAVGVLQCIFNHNVQFSIENILDICHLISRNAPNRSKIIHCLTEIPSSVNSLAVNSCEHPRLVKIFMDLNQNKCAPHDSSDSLNTNKANDAESEAFDDTEFRLIIPQRNVCKFTTFIEFDKRFTNRLIGTDAAMTLLIEHVAHVAISFHRVPGKTDKRQVSVHSMKAANLFAATNFIELLLHYNLGFEMICCALLRNPSGAEHLLSKLNRNETGPWKYDQLRSHPVWNPDGRLNEASDERDVHIDKTVSLWLSESYIEYSPARDVDEMSHCKCGVQEVDFDEFLIHWDDFQITRCKQEHFTQLCDPLGLRCVE